MRLTRSIRAALARMLRSLPLPGRWRLAHVLNRAFRAEVAEAPLASVGTMRLDLTDTYQMEMYWAGLQRDDRSIVRLMQAVVPADGVFIDIGANIGVITLAAARHVAVGGGAVVAFEPHPHNFRTLIEQIELNRLRHVSAHEVGLAEAPAMLTCRGPARGNWSLASRDGITFDVRLVRLDDHLDEHPLPRLDMIKIDVEGAEVRALQGARRTIARFKPVIAFEMCPAWLRRMNTSPAELLALLEELGYTIHPLTDGPPGDEPRITSADAYESWGPGQWTNLVALPASQTPRRAQAEHITADVVTDIPGKPGRFWGDHTRCVGPTKPPAWLVRGVGSGLAHDLCGSLAAVRMFLRRGSASGVVTDGGASGVMFAMLQRLFSWNRRPHVMVDCNWYESPSALKRWLKRKRLQMAEKAVTRFVVWASHEVEDYAAAFGLPREKLQYVPFHTTLHDYTYEVRDDGYLFAGGNYDRDYPTLVEAVRELSVPTWIVTTRPEQLAGVTIPKHVRVEGTSVEGFRQAMAAAHAVIVPMQKGLLHSGGQQTCLNAMYLGKPTIAVGRKWATDFITDGVDGLIVDYEDPVALRRAIRWVMNYPAAARAMGERARERAAWFSTERTMRTVYQIVKGESSAEVRTVRSEERRVLTVVRWPVGGIRTHILYTYQALAEAGYRFTFVLPTEGAATFAESLAHLPGCEFIEVPVRGKRCPLWATVRRVARQGRFGLIHSHGLTAAVHGVLGNFGLGLPHLNTVHDVFRADQFIGWKGWLKRRLLARLVRRISTIASVSQDVQDNLLDYLPVVGRPGGPRLLTIPNGIDTRPYCAGASIDAEGLRQRVGCPADAMLLGFLGRFMEQKGFTYLLQALEILRRDGSPPSFHLVAVGSGDCRGRAQREIVSRGLEGQVSIVDFVPDVLPLLRQFDLLVVPSLWEASSLVSMEAMSAGVPVLGSDCIGLREVLRGTPARQFTTGDVPDLVRALREELAGSRSAEARAFAGLARTRFDSRQYAARFLEEFDQMFDPRRIAHAQAARSPIATGDGASEQPAEVPALATQ